MNCSCINAPHCEHRHECDPAVCDSFVPPANRNQPKGGEKS